MNIFELSPSKQVAFFLPQNWWMKRGDVCLYADGDAPHLPGQVCYVERAVSGYKPIVFYALDTSKRDPLTLTFSEASFLVKDVNRTVLAIEPHEMNKIVWSSMAMQEVEQRLAAGGAA